MQNLLRRTPNSRLGILKQYIEKVYCQGIVRRDGVGSTSLCCLDTRKAVLQVANLAWLERLSIKHHFLQECWYLTFVMHDRMLPPRSEIVV